MKAGNRLEGKTWRTLHLVAVGHSQPKAALLCEGTKVNQSMQLRNRAMGREENCGWKAKGNDPTGGDEPAGRYVCSARVR